MERANIENSFKKEREGKKQGSSWRETMVQERILLR